MDPASARTDGCLLRLLWRCQNLSLCSYILLSPLRQIIPYNLCYIDWKQMMPSQSINCWGPNHYAEWSLNLLSASLLGLYFMSSIKFHHNKLCNVHKVAPSHRECCFESKCLLFYFLYSLVFRSVLRSSGWLTGVVARILHFWW